MVGFRCIIVNTMHKGDKKDDDDDYDDDDDDDNNNNNNNNNINTKKNKNNSECHSVMGSRSTHRQRSYSK